MNLCIFVGKVVHKKSDKNSGYLTILVERASSKIGSDYINIKVLGRNLALMDQLAEAGDYVSVVASYVNDNYKDDLGRVVYRDSLIAQSLTPIPGQGTPPSEPKKEVVIEDAAPNKEEEKAPKPKVTNPDSGKKKEISFSLDPEDYGLSRNLLLDEKQE